MYAYINHNEVDNFLMKRKTRTYKDTSDVKAMSVVKLEKI